MNRTLLAAGLLLLAAASLPAQAPASRLRVPYVIDTLSNGLTLIARKPAPAQISRPRSGPTTVYLVDKPGAAQSVVRMGHAGVDRSSSNYYAIQVVNTLLDGSFSSRLNSNLRETKGYTYGARSAFRRSGPASKSSAWGRWS